MDTIDEKFSRIIAIKTYLSQRIERAIYVENCKIRTKNRADDHSDCSLRICIYFEMVRINYQITGFIRGKKEVKRCSKSEI